MVDRIPARAQTRSGSDSIAGLRARPYPVESVWARTSGYSYFALQMASVGVQLYHLKQVVTLVVDASTIIAMLTGEPERASIIELTKDVDLIAPCSVHWENGNAPSAIGPAGARVLVSHCFNEQVDKYI